MASVWDNIWNQYANWYANWGDAMAGMPESQFQYGEEQPKASYALWKGYQGGAKPYRSWLDSQYDKWRDTYEGLAYLNPTLRWQDYLSTLNPNTEYAATNPTARGERPTAFSGRARWAAF